MINGITILITYSDTERNIALDEYKTPMDLIEACFKHAIVPLFDGLAIPVDILDVGANDGRWGKVARKYFPYANITGIEIMTMPQPDQYDDWIVGDYITHTFSSPFDLVVGNLPFTVKHENGKPKYKAEQFVRKSLSITDDFGFVAHLLRSNFRHSIERYWIDKQRTVPGLWQTHPAYQVFDFVMRPSFYREDKRTAQYGTKQTNAHDNALFVWWTHWKQSYYIGKHLDWNYT